MSRLHRYSRLGRYEKVAQCLAEGEEIDAVSISGLSALELAAGGGHLEIVKLLLKAGAAHCSIPFGGRSAALHEAAGSGHLEVVQILIEHGADVNARDSAQCTPAIRAAMKRNREMISYLERHGADLSLKDNRGYTTEKWLNEIERLHQIASTPRESTGKRIRQLMSEYESPEAFAAKHGRHTLVWSYGHYRYADPALGKWALRVSEILQSPELLAECEERYLEGETLEEARKLRARRVLAKARRERKKADS